MHLQRTIKAGILPYALLMLAVFSLLLQFYMERQKAEQHLVMVARQETRAYAVAVLAWEDFQKVQALKDVSETSKEEKENSAISELPTKATPSSALPYSMRFDAGEAFLRLLDKKIEVTVVFDGGGSFSYRFPLAGQES